MKKANLLHSATFLLSHDESVKVEYAVGNLMHSMRFAIDPALTETAGRLDFFEGRHIIYVPQLGPLTALSPVKASDGKSEWRISVQFAQTAHLVNVALVEFID